MGKLLLPCVLKESMQQEKFQRSGHVYDLEEVITVPLHYPPPLELMYWEPFPLRLRHYLLALMLLSQTKNPLSNSLYSCTQDFLRKGVIHLLKLLPYLINRNRKMEGRFYFYNSFLDLLCAPQKGISEFHVIVILNKFYEKKGEYFLLQ